MNTNKNVAACQTVGLFSVYAIWCRVTNQHYVGVTGHPVYERIRQHKRGKKQFVDKEIKRIGWENFDWWIVESGVPKTLITEREQYWVEFFGSLFPNGYNKTIGGIAHFKHSEKTCAQMKTAHRGKKRKPFTDEHKAHISESRTGEKNPNYGKPAHNRGVPCPEETKAKIRKKLNGRKRPDQSERMKGENNPNFGKPMPEETKAKLRAKALERDVSGENNPHYGKHHTDKAKEAIRQSRLGKETSEKTKAILSAKGLASHAAKRAAKAAEVAEVAKAAAEAAKGTDAAAALQAAAEAAVAKAAEAAAEAQAKAEAAKAVVEAIEAAKKAANQSATP